ncbi:GNAT family N-acetyltransferase [Phenylobacterium sp.]|uniref:GNAT family N-acetyltransferase n=1 Tax=Phenylobacterium sp. TaxID=1871053 RepID=UPI0035B15D15
MQDEEAPNSARPSLEWRAVFQNVELNILHAECFEHDVGEHDWWEQLSGVSLGWVCARLDGDLVGFVNVAWDGGAHAFILDTMVTRAMRRKGLASQLIDAACKAARAAGCEWLHVDFEPHLRDFYFGACGFRPTDAGLIALR